MDTWCRPEGRVSWWNVFCVALHVRVGSRDFLSPSVESCFANGAWVDVCKSVHKPVHAGTHPHPLAHTVPCQSIVSRLVAVRIWRHVLELWMWKRYPGECSPVTQIGLSWLLPCIVTKGKKWRGLLYSRGSWQGLPKWILLNSLIRRENIKTCGEKLFQRV